MYKFFVRPDQIREKEIYITGQDCNHIFRVLRLKPGQEILLNDGQARDYYCIIKEANDQEIICQIRDVARNLTELPVEVTLFQGLPKQEKMEWIIQKGVELGLSHIYPVAMNRSIQKLDEKSGRKKVERWNKIAEGAAKQAGRGRVPLVHMPLSFKQVVDLSSRYDHFFVAHEQAKGMQVTRWALGQVKKASKIALMIGPEGGYAPEETQALKALARSQMITLGKRILRTETAGMTFMAMLSLMIEED